MLFSTFAKENSIIHLELLRTEFPEKFPVVIRTLLNSYGGKGIVLATNEQEFTPYYKKYFYTYFEPLAFELRVHVLEGNIIKIFKKVRAEEEAELYPIRNNDRGYHFSVRNVENYPKLTDYVHNLYEKFPMKMMGLDVGYSAEKRQYITIEVNSCPSLNELTINEYVNYLRDKI